MIFLIALAKAGPDEAEHVARAHRITNNTTKEPGTLLFGFGRFASDPSQMIVVEAYEDREALEAHARAIPNPRVQRLEGNSYEADDVSWKIYEVDALQVLGRELK